MPVPDRPDCEGAFCPGEDRAAWCPLWLSRAGAPLKSCDDTFFPRPGRTATATPYPLISPRFQATTLGAVLGRPLPPPKENARQCNPETTPAGTLSKPRLESVPGLHRLPMPRQIERVLGRSVSERIALEKLVTFQALRGLRAPYDQVQAFAMLRVSHVATATDEGRTFDKADRVLIDTIGL